jgi:hypothetical protein
VANKCIGDMHIGGQQNLEVPNKCGQSTINASVAKQKDIFCYPFDLPSITTRRCGQRHCMSHWTGSNLGCRSCLPLHFVLLRLGAHLHRYRRLPLPPSASRNKGGRQAEAALATPLPPVFVVKALPFTALFFANLFLDKTLGTADYSSSVWPSGLRKGA